jgi:hypothetical protein
MCDSCLVGLNLIVTKQLRDVAAHWPVPGRSAVPSKGIRDMALHRKYSRLGRAGSALAVGVAVAGFVATAWGGSAVAATSAVANTAVGSPVIAPIVQHQTARQCGAPAPGHAACLAIRQVNPVEPGRMVSDSVNPSLTPSGYGPSSLRSAYALPSSTAGSGQTVGIVDAYDDPKAESDLSTYRSQFGLPACTTANGCFRKVNQSGTSSPLPAADVLWAGEIALDLDMVSAICPNCHILLVEATSDMMSNLGSSVNTAVNLGAKFVSNSYGGSEWGGELSEDGAYFNHPGVAITASSGDSDFDHGSYPATSKYVTAVGGTSLVSASNSRGWSESVWNTASYTKGSGSGCSISEAKPSFQANVNTGCANRAESDVSAVADPNTGVAVYLTYGGSGWNIYGGTSAASPIIASVYALAGTPSSVGANSYPYAHAANLNDVTSGKNGTCGPPICTAGTGWDGPTGLGTPNGVTAFTPTGGSAPALAVANPGSESTMAGNAVSLQLSASGGTAPYSWTATGLPPGLSVTPAGLITGTPTTVGSYSTTATAKDATNSAAGATFTWSISAPSFCTGQKLLNPGFESGASNWTATGGVIDKANVEPANSGSWEAWLDGYGSKHSDTLYQVVTIPAGCHATLSYYLHIDTQERTTSVAYDQLMVSVGGSAVASYSNLNKAAGYTLRTFAFAPSTATRTVAVNFAGTEDSSLATSFVVDDTSLTLS